LGKLEVKGSLPLSDKIYARFLANGYDNNAIFDLDHQLNRDNCLYPFHLTREKLKNYGFEINTADLIQGKPTAFDLHMNVHRRGTTENSYLLMLETPQVFPKNGVESNWKKYRKIFTWNDDLVDNKRFIKINFPNLISVHVEDGFEKRDRFCCLIAGNKTLASYDSRNLYLERIKVIRWFERHAPQDFDLFGTGWHIPSVHQGIAGKIERRIFRALAGMLKLRPFPSYRGRIEHKREVLSRTRFSICYENVSDLPGYITEKIFDCFFSGCVPVYWGASNIANHIPLDCFIDRRRFSDTGDVYDFLKAMSEQEFKGYQQRIADFLSSEQAYPFSAEHFADTLVKTIVKDLDSQK
jgi:hypothetical protein